MVFVSAGKAGSAFSRRQHGITGKMVMVMRVLVRRTRFFKFYLVPSMTCLMWKDQNMGNTGGICGGACSTNLCGKKRKLTVLTGKEIRIRFRVDWNLLFLGVLL